MSAETPVPAPKKKPGKGKMIGGCCGIILLVVIVIAACSALFGGESTKDQSKPAATTSKAAAPAKEKASSKAPAKEKPSTKAVPASTTPAAKPTTTAAKPAREDPQKWANGIEKDAIALSGGSTWQEACGGTYDKGMCWISQIKAKRVGDLDITLQLNGKDSESKDYAKEAANYVFATAGPEHKELKSITVYDAAGVEIYHTKRSDNPMLD